MIIKPEKAILSRLHEISDINCINTSVADMLVTSFNYVDLFDKNEMQQCVQNENKEKEAMLETLYDFYKLDKNDESNQEIMNEYLFNNIHKLNPKEYLNNPYVKAVKNIGKKGKYSLRYLTYEPYQLFALDDIVINEANYKEYSQVGYFDQFFSYLALTENNNVWMSLNPNEINTMRPYIEKGQGRVLVLGLGMGYVPFMLALKDNVKSITIVERDQNIISLFNDLIYPDFINKEKIKIIQDDAIKYVSNNNQRFDYIFADLWHSPEDGLPLFLSLKKVDKNIDCWLEESFYALLRRCMITLLEETLDGLKEDDYRFAKNDTDKVINKYYQKTRNLHINNVKDLMTLLEKNNLLSLLLDSK